MINFEMFLFGLLITSTLTSLATEAFKNMFAEHNKTVPSNTLAGIVSLVLSLAIGIGYVILSGLTFTVQIIICIVALIFMSWLCAMVGYDKVIQAVSQFKTTREE